MTNVLYLAYFQPEPRLLTSIFCLHVTSLWLQRLCKNTGDFNANLSNSDLSSYDLKSNELVQ